MPRERDSNVKVPLLDGPSYIYHVRAREKIKVWYEKFFLSPNARACQERERETRARDFCDDEERVRRRGLLWWCAWLEARARVRAQWRHFTTLKCTWPANHLNALRFRCWRCVWNSSSSDQNVANNVMKRWQNGKRGVSQSKQNHRFGSRFNRFKILWFGQQLQQYLRASALVDDGKH